MDKRLLHLALLAAALGLAAATATVPAGAARMAPSVAAGTTDHSGVVRSIAAGSLAIATAKGKSYSFTLNGDTSYRSLDGKIAASAVKAGATVNVTFTTAGTTLTATEVVVGVVTPAGPFFSTKAKGEVSAVSPTALTVTTSKGKAIPFRIAAGLKVERLGKKLALADVKVADQVKVRFAIGSDGTLTATDIAIGAPSAAGVLYSDVEKGTVVSATASRLQLDTGSPSPLPLAIVAASKLRRLGKKIPVSALTAGSKVKASFTIVAGGALQAESIDLGVASVAGTLYSGKERGTVRAISASELTLATRKGEELSLRIDAHTSFARDGVAAKPGTIRAGDVVKLRLDVIAGGALLATDVEAGRTFRGSLVFATRQRGTVVRVTGRTLVLRTAKGKTLDLTVAPVASVAVAGVGALMSDLAGGDEVKVEYLRISRNLATSVHVVAGKSDFKAVGKVVRANGQVLSLRVASLSRGGVRQPRLAGKTVAIAVPAGALVRSHGHAARLDGLPAGSALSVIGRMAGPRLVARHVVG